MDKNEQRRGYMTEVLGVAIKYMFEIQNIHRIMANYLVDNLASAVVLKKPGFVIEGKAARYLRIAGRWQDHVLTSVTNTQWMET